MPRYRYRAINDQGNLDEGAITAWDEKDLEAKLNEKGYYLIHAKETIEVIKTGGTQKCVCIRKFIPKIKKPFTKVITALFVILSEAKNLAFQEILRALRSLGMTSMWGFSGFSTYYLSLIGFGVLLWITIGVIFFIVALPFLILNGSKGGNETVKKDFLQSYTGYLDAGNGNVEVFRRPDFNPFDPYEPKFNVAQFTKAMLLDYIKSTHCVNVRILEGPYAGSVGYLPGEFYKRK